jgi:hypothetical protein
MYKFIIYFLLMTQTSWASIVVWPLGFIVRLERDEDQSMISQKALQFAGGVKIQNWSIELSRTQYSSETQEGSVSVSREYQDMTLWLGHHFPIVEKIDFVGWGGLGTYNEKIITVVGAASDTSTSKQKTLLGLSGELRWKPYDFGWLLSTGARLVTAESFDPNPQPEFFIRAGWQF